MRSAAALLVILVLASSSSSCYRARYLNLRAPELGVVPPSTPARPEAVSRWQHFFVFGWVPGERVIDAARACGGPENVQAIETRQTFAQGLIAFLTTVYVPIYTPYNGDVVCKGAIRR